MAMQREETVYIEARGECRSGCVTSTRACPHLGRPDPRLERYHLLLSARRLLLPTLAAPLCIRVWGLGFRV